MNWSDPTLIVLMAVASALLAVLVTVRWVRGRRSWLARSRSRRGQRAEIHAETLLQRAGYRIESRQVTGRWSLVVDGESVEVTCRADLIVRRRRHRFVAEVKSGRVGSDPTSPATRRQLLEYQRVFDVSGVLLVDMLRGRIHKVEFQDARRR